MKRKNAKAGKIVITCRKHGGLTREDAYGPYESFNPVMEKYYSLYHCKKCKLAHNRKYYSTHSKKVKDKARKYHNKYYKKNRVKLRAYYLARYYQNKGDLSMMRKYRKMYG